MPGLGACQSARLPVHMHPCHTIEPFNCRTVQCHASTTECFAMRLRKVVCEEAPRSSHDSTQVTYESPVPTGSGRCHSAWYTMYELACNTCQGMHCVHPVSQSFLLMQASAKSSAKENGPAWRPNFSGRTGPVASVMRMNLHALRR